MRDRKVGITAVRWRRCILLVVVLVLCAVAPGWAAAAPPPDPSQNIPLGVLPNQCFGSPRGSICENGVIYWLDQARASLGLAPYALPADFTALPPIEQLFILTNLDRTAYGLTPITGMTDALNADANTLVGGDPRPTDPNFTNWASSAEFGGPNAENAYNDWVYDDGPGSQNSDCPPDATGGCWGHRHVVFWDVDGGGPSAMGVASGPDAATMIVGSGNASYQPTYSYTWAQAQADGAGNHVYTPPATVAVNLAISGKGEIAANAGGQGGGGCEDDVSPCVLETPATVPLTLSAGPDLLGGDNQQFVGWSGACSGVSPTCTITPQQSGLSVMAHFAAAGTGGLGSGGTTGAGHPAKPQILRLIASRGTILAALGGSGLKCTLSRRHKQNWRTLHVSRCRRAVIYRHLSADRYRLTVTSGKTSVSKTVTLRHGVSNSNKDRPAPPKSKSTKRVRAT